MFKYLPIGNTDSINLNDIGSINDELSKLTVELNDSINATRPLQSQVSNMQSQIAQIKTQVSGIEADVANKQKTIDASYRNLAQKEQLLNQTIRDFYIKSTYNSPILILLSSQNAAELTQVLTYQQVATNQDKAVITNLALSITDLEQQKKDLQTEQTQLLALKTNLDDQSAKLNTIIQGAQAYQASLSSQIAELSTRQQELIAQKEQSLGLPTTAYTTSGGCSSDLTNGKDPGFSPKFAAFTYGVPHRVGMSQYGALGRAEAGQSDTDILNAYFANSTITNVGSGQNITVNGTNDYGETFSNQSMNVEDYLKHIYEMPSNWPSEALKAQAIAARSFIMHALSSGQATVAPNQSFQEVKTELNAQAWIDAVNATAGQVMESGGQPIEAWFSSTAGGYFHSSSDLGWSSTSYTKTGVDAIGSVNSFTDLINNAYDGPAHANSPWFYCDWGSRSQYAGTAWLTSGELADIVNVILLAKKDSSTQTHLAQIDKPNPDGVDTWGMDQVRQKLGLGAFTNISSISVSADFTSGQTATVTVTGDGGTQTFSGSDFKNYFNLRAPSNINIVGPLYNIEER